MNKDIRKLLSQKAVTGEQVGQALIRDMVHLCFDAYAAPDEPPEPLLTEEEKHRLVAMLADPQDVRVYGQYRSVQAYLSSYQLVFSSVSESVESAFARIYSSLVTVRDAEQIYAEFVEEGVSPELSAMKSLRDMGFSGVFGQLYEGMRNTMDQFYQSLRMCVAHERGLEIVAARIQVPELLLYEQMTRPPYGRLNLLLSAKSMLKDTLRRVGRPEEDAKLLDLLLPDTTQEELEPDRANLQKAVKLLQEDLTAVEEPMALMMLICGNGRDRR